MKPSFPLLSAIAFLLLTACSPNRQKVEEAQQNIEQALKEISLIEDRILEAGNRSDSLRLIEFNSEEERRSSDLLPRLKKNWPANVPPSKWRNNAWRRRDRNTAT